MKPDGRGKKAENGADARAWLLWVLAAAVLAMAARNPLYTLIILLAAVVVNQACRQPNHGFDLPLWRIGLVILTFSTLFNAFFIEAGQTILFRLPANWPLIGGAVTLEGALYGAANGLILLTLLAIFLVLNALVPVSQLARLTPNAFHDLGVVLLIALTYVPETVRHLERIREAQAIRGHQLRGLRDWRPIVLPLLIGGMERAMQLAETMVARGYGATTSQEQSGGTRVALLLALAITFLGWFMALWQGGWGWLGLVVLGLALLLWLIWRNGRLIRRTSYHPARWQKSDALIAASGLLPALLVLLPWPFVDQASLTYIPYPVAQLPPFDPLIGVGLAALVLPALRELF